MWICRSLLFLVSDYAVVVVKAVTGCRRYRRRSGNRLLVFRSILVPSSLIMVCRLGASGKISHKPLLCFAPSVNRKGRWLCGYGATDFLCFIDGVYAFGGPGNLSPPFASEVGVSAFGVLAVVVAGGVICYSVMMQTRF